MAAPAFLESRKQMPLISLEVRSSVAPLSAGRVLLSPGSQLSAEQLRSAGDVTDIVAPSLLHMGGVPAAIREHPGARVWGPRGAREARPNVPWTHILGTDPWLHDGELTAVSLAGVPKLQETVFVHRASRSLFVADLVFNIAPPPGLGPWLLLHAFGTYRRLGVPRPFRAGVKDREAFRRSVAQVLALDFTDLVPTHGTVVRGDGKARLTAAIAEAGFA